MRTANPTNKALLLFTLLFTAIAAVSFAAFQTTEQACSEVKKCSGAMPLNNGEIIWDGFSRRLISFVSLK